MAHVGDAAAEVFGGLAEGEESAVGGSGETGEQAQEGGFARTVFTQDDGDGARGEREGEIADGSEGAEDLRDGRKGRRRGGSGFVRQSGAVAAQSALGSFGRGLDGAIPRVPSIGQGRL